MTEQDETLHGGHIFSFRMCVGGEFAGERFSRLQDGVRSSVRLYVFRHSLSSSFPDYPCNAAVVHKRHESDRIRQRIGRIG